MKRGGPLRRTPMKRSGPRRTAPKKKRAGVTAEVAEFVLTRDEGCVAHRRGFATDVRCQGRPHVHHVVLRSHGGAHTPDNLIVLCERMHTMAHANPSWAKCCGLIVPSWAEQSDVMQHAIRLQRAISRNEVPPVASWVTDTDLRAAATHDERWVRAAALVGREL